ncbi:2-hydroxy-6-oxononadienedioate/2-hydroxy-6-oxononatrienedioate hydrolase [Ananas comosus]|uniref:2-hydroxy-6-oxononadienedioate/2-hydroxy-6-oxononatrienedioate hydrolase n=1 Tax=Ananas comosus TaxID=4615 RepID=A0A199V795_ANACO|nr:2-hydroxy-6-oxononadienedioate/2-hydroxy-6-oxononatrienedioate hydrolase [Ananas comosus]
MQFLLPAAATAMASCGLATARASARVRVSASEFPSFLPKEVERIKDSCARELAKRIERVPVKVSFSKSPILSSCVKPLQQQSMEPVVLLHGFDRYELIYMVPCSLLLNFDFRSYSAKPLKDLILSSCLEWRYTYPLLEDAGIEAWAVDILGWGFSNLETLPKCDVAAKREHLYEFWRSYIKIPMVLVGPSLGAAVAIDFAACYPEAVSKLIFIAASVYAEGTGNLSKLPKVVAYAGMFVLKSFPLRLYATTLTFNSVPAGSSIDWTNVGRLHCLLPWWKDATVHFMISGGYNVINQIKQIKHKSLIIWGEDDQIIDKKLALRLHDELPHSALHYIPQCGHIPHVEKPKRVAKLILEFLRGDVTEKQKPWLSIASPFQIEEEDPLNQLMGNIVFEKAVLSQ